MTATEFKDRYPRPWRYERERTSFALKAANGTVLGYLQIARVPSGEPRISQMEHIAEHLAEHPVGFDHDPEGIAHLTTP